MITNDNSQRYRYDAAMRRVEMITPMLEEGIDRAKRQMLRRQQSEKYHVSIRSLFRYEKAYRELGFQGLMPEPRAGVISKAMPENFTELLDEAVLLKREVPSRSVNQIIYILETEGRTSPGVLKRSTLQKHLYDRGFGKKQMKKYSEAGTTSSKRFCKPHRMMLVESDIKYGPKLPLGPDGKVIQTYLATILDDHSRMPIDSKFHLHQQESIVAEGYRRAILTHGKMDMCYHDNGGQYISRQLILSLAKLGIKVLRAKPYAPQSKGAVEVFNRAVSQFNDEIRAHKKHIKTLDDLNNYWQYWIEEYYSNKAHEGIAEYYRSHGREVPAGGISPRQEWNRDSRPLTFMDVSVVAAAFMHHDKRTVDSAGCISFKGRTYETNISLIGATVDIAYDPENTETIRIFYKGIEAFDAKPLVIDEFCDPKPAVPACMLPIEPESSRFLEALAKKHEEKSTLRADAISFGSFRKEVPDNV